MRDSLMRFSKISLTKKFSRTPVFCQRDLEVDSMMIFLRTLLISLSKSPVDQMSDKGSARGSGATEAPLWFQRRLGKLQKKRSTVMLMS